METLVSVASEWGYLGIFLSAFIAGSILAFPSEGVLLLVLHAGANPIAAIAVATLGNWIGGATIYYMGRLGKLSWLERVGISSADIEKWRARINRFGPYVGILTWVPILGDAIPAALGYFRANVRLTMLFIFIGKLARYVVLTLSYYGIIKLL